MPRLVTLDRQNDVAVITIQNPPVNALSPGVPEGIAASLDEAEQDASVRAIVIVGGGRTFIAGADIKELEKAAAGAAAGPDLHWLLQNIEDCSQARGHGPARHGAGRGPGSGHGGTLPRGHPRRSGGPAGSESRHHSRRGGNAAAAAVGRASRRPWICASAASRSKRPRRLRLGLIDRVIEGDLLTGAVSFAREAASAIPPKTRDRNDKLGSPAANAPIFAAGRELARKTRRNMTAPLAAIDALEAAATLPFDEGCRKEREIMFGVHRLRACRALIHAFFAERAVAKIPGIPQDTAVYADSQSRHHRRGHHGRRHRHGLRQRRDRGGAQRSRSKRRSTAAWRPFARTTKAPSRRAASPRRPWIKGWR